MARILSNSTNDSPTKPGEFELEMLVAGVPGCEPGVLVRLLGGRSMVANGFDGRARPVLRAVGVAQCAAEGTEAGGG